MKKQLLITLLLSLFNITKTQIVETQKLPVIPEQILVLETLLFQQIKFHQFYNKYQKFDDFNNVEALIKFSHDIEKLDNYFKANFLPEFLLNLLQKSCHQLQSQEEVFLYIKDLIIKLIWRKLQKCEGEYLLMSINKNLEGLLGLSTSIRSFIAKYSELELSSRCKFFDTYFENIIAAAELDAFLLKYKKINSINSYEKFNKFKEKALLIDSFIPKKYFPNKAITLILETIKNLIKENSESLNLIYEPFFLNNLKILVNF